MAEQGEVPIPERAIQETRDSVSYLGVKLPKATQNSGLVPKREDYTEYVGDRDVSLPMQRALAVNFLLGLPTLVEGGGATEKLEIVKKMAAELGWEVHNVSLLHEKSIEDLFGKYISNRFYDGPVTDALRQEEGKVKIIVFEDLSAADPMVRQRLSWLTTELKFGLKVKLPNGEEIAPDNKVTKVIGLMDPPIEGWTDREPLTQGELWGWAYYKSPAALPKAGLSPGEKGLSLEEYPQSRGKALSAEEFESIPGVEEVLTNQLPAFCKAANELVRDGLIAKHQSQPLRYHNQEGRVRYFVRYFYNGNLNETIRASLQHFYANALESKEDKAKLEELIGDVGYVPPPQSVSGEERKSEGHLSPELPKSATIAINNENYSFERNIDTRDSAFVKRVSVYKGADGERIALKVYNKDETFREGVFRGKKKGDIFRKEFKHFQRLHERGVRKWFPKPIGIVSNTGVYGEEAIALSLCPGEKLGNLLRDRNFTRKLRGETLIELTHLLESLLDAGILNYNDWKTNDVIVDRTDPARLNVYYVDLNGAKTIEECEDEYIEALKKDFPLAPIPPDEISSARESIIQDSVFGFFHTMVREVDPTIPLPQKPGEIEDPKKYLGDFRTRIRNML